MGEMGGFPDSEGDSPAFPGLEHGNQGSKFPAKTTDAPFRTGDFPGEGEVGMNEWSAPPPSPRVGETARSRQAMAGDEHTPPLEESNI